MTARQLDRVEARKTGRGAERQSEHWPLLNTGTRLIPRAADEVGGGLVVDNALPQGSAWHFLADVDLVNLGLDGDVLHVQAHGKRDAGARLYQTHALLLNQDRIRRGLSGTRFAQVYQNSLLNFKKEKRKRRRRRKKRLVHGTNSLTTSDIHLLHPVSTLFSNLTYFQQLQSTSFLQNCTQNT